LIRGFGHWDSQLGFGREGLSHRIEKFYSRGPEFGDEFGLYRFNDAQQRQIKPSVKLAGSRKPY
jgi:hypothetical protein